MNMVEISMSALVIVPTFVFLFGTLIGALAREKRIRELEKASGYDELTGLRKSRSLECDLLKQLKKKPPKEKGERHISSLERSGTLDFLDVDGFKNVNDSCGHDTGDEILRILGKVISANLRSRDLAIRRSDAGDEFIVLLVDATVAAASTLFLEVRGQFENAISWAFPDLPAKVSFSFGAVKVRSTDRVSCVKRAVGIAEKHMREDKDVRKLGR
jgi:diguanylate cyclase (GGDEF)-like protein